MNERSKFNRRQIIKAGTVVAASMLIARTGNAEEVLSESDPTALALGYHEDATQVDTSKWQKKAGTGGAEQRCNNCSLYQKQDDNAGGCSIFPGKLVAGAGWCNAWMG
jgi:hypothetical protein